MAHRAGHRGALRTMAIALLAAASACHRNQVSPAPSSSGERRVPFSAIVSTDSGAPERGSVVVRGATGNPRMDARAMAAVERAITAAAEVDTIVVARDTIRVPVGKTLSLSGLRVSLRNEAGQVVRGAVPLYRVEPRELAQVHRGYVLALRPGVATLWVQTLRMMPGPHEERPTTRVVLQIVER